MSTDPGAELPETEDENPGPPDGAAWEDGAVQDDEGDPALHRDDDSDDDAGGDDLEPADGDD